MRILARVTSLSLSLFRFNQPVNCAKVVSLDKRWNSPDLK